MLYKDRPIIGFKGFKDSYQDEPRAVKQEVTKGLEAIRRYLPEFLYWTIFHIPQGEQRNEGFNLLEMKRFLEEQPVDVKHLDKKRSSTLLVAVNNAISRFLPPKE